MEVELVYSFLYTFLRAFGVLVVFQSAREYLRTPGILALSVAFALCLAPLLPVGVPQTVLTFSAQALFEVLMGVLLGLPLALTLESLVMGGRLVDVIRGAQYGEQVSPLGESQAAMVQRATMLFLLVIAFSFNGYRSLVATFVENVESIRFSQAFKHCQALLSLSAVEGVLVTSAKAIADGLFFAAPVVVISLIIDGTLGFLQRALGQGMSLQVEFSSVKLIVGLVAFSLVIYRWHLSGDVTFH